MKKMYTPREYQKLIQKKSKLTESQEQALLCEWIKSTYPKALYVVDLAGLNLTPSQRIIYKTRCKRGVPDFMMQEWFQDKFCGLAIEFKRTGEKIFKQYS